MITIPEEYRDPSLVEHSPSESRSVISDLDLPLVTPPPIEALQNSNTYYNDGFTTTKRAAYENTMASSSRRAPVRATAVGQGAERDAEQNAVLAGDPKGLVYYVMID